MKFLKLGLVFLVAALVAALAFAAFTYRHAYYALRTNFSQFEKKYSAERSALSQRSALWHGEIVDVDAERREFTLALNSQILAGYEDVRLVITTVDSTLFVRQRLVVDDGAYVGFSETVEGSINDLAPGMLVAVSFSRNPETLRAIAETVLFGGAF